MGRRFVGYGWMEGGGWTGWGIKGVLSEWTGWVVK